MKGTVAAVALGLAALVPAGVAQAAPAAGSGYAALGDSYSAGAGAGTYLDNSSCRRSANSYPALLAQDRQFSTFTFEACSGATVADVAASQLGGLDADTALVTVTAGGNDVGFSPVLNQCLTGGEAACLTAIQSSRAVATGALPARLDSLYAGVKARAPGAQLLVLGYPRLLELTAQCAGVPMSLASRTAIDDAVDLLDQVIAERADAAGATFVDVRSRFAGHAVCAADPWINGLVPDGAFHPNAAGQRSGYLAAVPAPALDSFLT